MYMETSENKYFENDNNVEKEQIHHIKHNTVQ